LSALSVFDSQDHPIDVKDHGKVFQLSFRRDRKSAQARARGNCATADNIYQAFINELQAQSGHGVDEVSATIMILDERYLIAHHDHAGLPMSIHPDLSCGDVVGQSCPRV
jgi:hypothetical protein